MSSSASRIHARTGACIRSSHDRRRHRARPAEVVALQRTPAARRCPSRAEAADVVLVVDVARRRADQDERANGSGASTAASTPIIALTEWPTKMPRRARARADLHDVVGLVHRVPPNRRCRAAAPSGAGRPHRARRRTPMARRRWRWGRRDRGNGRLGSGVRLEHRLLSTVIAPDRRARPHASRDGPVGIRQPASSRRDDRGAGVEPAPDTGGAGCADISSGARLPASRRDPTSHPDRMVRPMPPTRERLVRPAGAGRRNRHNVPVRRTMARDLSALTQLTRRAATRSSSRQAPATCGTLHTAHRSRNPESIDPTSARLGLDLVGTAMPRPAAGPRPVRRRARHGSAQRASPEPGSTTTTAGPTSCCATPWTAPPPIIQPICPPTSHAELIGCDRCSGRPG